MSSLNGNNAWAPSVDQGRGYSADVALYLVFPDGSRLSPNQIGPDRVIFNDPVQVPAGPAVVELFIDGNPRRWNVVLAGQDKPARVVRMIVA
jgi:hypothetical protein